MRRRAFLGRAAAVGLAGTVTGCLGLSAAGSEAGFEETWRFDASGLVDAVAEGQVLGRGDAGAEALDGVFALDVETGEKRWTYGTSGGLSRYTPLVVDDAIYFGLGTDTSGPGQLYAVERDGTERWTRDTGGVRLPPTLLDGVLYVGSDGGHVQAIDADTGEERWRTDLGSFPEFESFPVLTVAGDVVYVAGGGLFALDRSDGSVRWRYGDDSDWITRAVVNGGTAFVGTRERVAAVADGTELWHTTLDGGGVEVYGVDTGRLLVEAGGRLHALAVPDGEKQWSTDEFDPMRVVMGDGTVYLGGQRLAAYAVEEGDERWHVPVASGSEVRALSLAGPGGVRGLWNDERLFARTADRIVQVSPDGDVRWERQFDDRLQSHLFDGGLYVATSESVYALEPQ